MSSFRTSAHLIKVLDDYECGQFVEVRLYGWKPHREVLLPVSLLPEGMIEIIESSPGPHECKMNIYFYADLSAERAADLDIKGPWELNKYEQVDATWDDNNVLVDTGITPLEDYKWDENGKFLNY